MFGTGLFELLIIITIILLIFGVGRFSKVAGELGRGIKNFKQNFRSKNEENENVPNHKGD